MSIDEAKLVELERLLEDFNVTDDELQRIRNRAEGTSDTLIWSRMLQTIIEFAREVRRPLPALIAAVREGWKARAEVERLRTALEWYAEQARDCRKLFGIPEGDAARAALDRDGGKRARTALEPTP